MSTDALRGSRMTSLRWSDGLTTTNTFYPCYTWHIQLGSDVFSLLAAISVAEAQHCCNGGHFWILSKKNLFRSFADPCKVCAPRPATGALPGHMHLGPLFGSVTPRGMYWRRASIQDGQAFTSAWWRHCSEMVFRDNFVTFRRRSKRIAFLESVNFSTCAICKFSIFMVTWPLFGTIQRPNV